MKSSFKPGVRATVTMNGDPVRIQRVAQVTPLKVILDDRTVWSARRMRPWQDQSTLDWGIRVTRTGDADRVDRTRTISAIRLFDLRRRWDELTTAELRRIERITDAASARRKSVA